MANLHAELKIGQRIFDITRDRLWSERLTDAMDEARRTGKYLLIAAGADAARSWKLGVALAFLDEDMIAVSRNFHCVTVIDNRNTRERLIDRPAIMICTPEGREIVSASADTVEELIPALRGMVEHVAAVDRPAKRCVGGAQPVLMPSVRQFIGSLAHAILGV